MVFKAISQASKIVSWIYQHLLCDLASTPSRLHGVKTFDWYTRSWEPDLVARLHLILSAYILLAVNFRGTNCRNWHVKKLNFTEQIFAIGSYIVNFTGSIFTMRRSNRSQNDSEVTIKMSFSLTKRHIREEEREGNVSKCIVWNIVLWKKCNINSVVSVPKKKTNFSE